MTDQLNINMAIHAYNFKKKKSERMNQQKLGAIIFPDLEEKQAGWRISRICSGDQAQARLLPSQIRKICEVLECDVSFLFLEPEQ